MPRAVLNYHSVRNGGELPLSVPVEEFRWQMEYLARRGFRGVSLEEGYDGPDEGNRNVILTFDDGYRDNYTQAFPILRELGFTATFYVTVDFLDRAMISWHRDPGQGETMRWEDLREMIRAGMRVGSHTLSHPRLSMISAEQVRRELAESKAAIEERLGTEVLSFAYPSGDFTREVKEMVPETGYAMAVALVPPPGIPEDRYAIPRIGISVRDCRWRFRLKVSKMFPFISVPLRMIRRYLS